MAGDHPRPSNPIPTGDHVRWRGRPGRTGGVLLVAFEGWSDAGDAASTAVRYLTDQWELEPFADIDPEIFYDFSVTRPRVELDDDLQRQIVWPELTFSSGQVAFGEIDGLRGGGPAATLIGAEPQLRWRTFAAQVVEVATACEVELAVTVGALLADVSHAQPVSVIGTAYDPDVVEQLGLTHSSYEGPTGILGVLHDALGRAGLPSASFWAAVPSYVPGAPSPKAQLALIERLADLLGVGLMTTDLEIASASYERQITELVEADDDTAAYVRGLGAGLRPRRDPATGHRAPAAVAHVRGAGGRGGHGV